MLAARVPERSQKRATLFLRTSTQHHRVLLSSKETEDLGATPPRKTVMMRVRPKLQPKPRTTKRGRCQGYLLFEFWTGGTHSLVAFLEELELESLLRAAFRPSNKYALISNGFRQISPPTWGAQFRVWGAGQVNPRSALKPRMKRNTTKPTHPCSQSIDTARVGEGAHIFAIPRTHGRWFGNGEGLLPILLVSFFFARFTDSLEWRPC